MDGRAGVGDGGGPLTGFAVGVTAARRQEDEGGLAALLAGLGARVVHAPAVRLVPPPDDARLLGATRALVAGPPDHLIVAAGVGFRGWLAAAAGWGLREELLEGLAKARVVAWGAEAYEAVRSAGLRAEPAPEGGAPPAAGEPWEQAGARVAVQVPEESLPEVAGPLRRAGAEIVEVPGFGWQPAEDPTPLRRLVGQAVAGTVDAIAFTSAPAVAATLAVAAEDGLVEPLLAALRDQVVAACVGPVTAQALVARRVPTVQPERARVAALAGAIAADLPSRRARRIRAGGHALELRGHAVVLDGQVRLIAPAPMAILRALARRPGHVVSRGELRGVLPGRPKADEHAVEMAVARLRRGLGRSGIVETVVKRGYRLACDPRAAA